MTVATILEAGLLRGLGVEDIAVENPQVSVQMLRLEMRRMQRDGRLDEIVSRAMAK